MVSKNAGPDDPASGRTARRVSVAQMPAAVGIRLRMAIIGAIAVIAVGGTTPSMASAYTEVWLNNPTSVPFTAGESCLFVGSVPCSDFPEWQKGAVLAAGRSNPGIRIGLQVTGPSFDAVRFTDTWYPSGVSGHFNFEAVDPPVGPTVVKCYGEGELPGFSCSVVDELFAYLHQASSSSKLLGGSPSAEAAFWSGVAPVRGGAASVPVVIYPTGRRGTARERVLLRGSNSKVLGRGEKTLPFGKRSSIEVRLAAGVARSVAAGKSVNVHASVGPPQGVAGAGRATRIVLTKRTA